jgi:hypothetical protein
MKSLLKPLLIIVTLLLAGLGQFGPQKDFHYDLRNRITGARLMEQHRSPYFFQWQPTDGERTFDPLDDESTALTRTTVTPFFLRMMAVLNHLDEPQIQTTWFLFSYLLLSGSCFLLCIAAEKKHRFAIILLFAMSLLSFPWQHHLFAGQYYVLLLFLFSALYVLLKQEKNYIQWQIAASFVFFVLLLIRPTAILFLMPFVFYPKRFKILLGSTIVLLLLYTAWIFASGEFLFWKDYITMLEEWNRIFLSNGADIIKRNTHQFASIEGQPFHINHNITLAQISNIPALFQLAFQQTLPSITGPIIIAALIALFAWRRWKIKIEINIHELFITAFLLYISAEFLLQIYRFNYNAIQWLFPLAILFTEPLSNNIRKYIAALCVAGWLLNLSFFHFIPMNTFIGEVLIALAIFLFIIYSWRNSGQIKTGV